MTNPLNCDEFASSLSDLVERNIDQPRMAALEGHAFRCNDCGPLLADLRRLRIEAANLPELVPSRDLWSGIAQRIATPVISLGHERVAARPSLGRHLRTGLAAAGLVAATAGITHLMTRRALAPAQTTASAPIPVATVGVKPSTPVDSHTVTAQAPTQVAPAATSPAQPSALALTPVANRNALAEVTYGREIARLRAIVDRRQAQLDPITVSIIERNLKIIDDAIAQSRLALERDPASRFLMQSLNDALENKIELLRTAATLSARS
jgi:hypothetical protein